MLTQDEIDKLSDLQRRIEALIGFIDMFDILNPHVEREPDDMVNPIRRNNPLNVNRKTRTAWTPSETETFRHLLSQGKKPKEIAAIMGKSYRVCFHKRKTENRRTKLERRE